MHENEKQIEDTTQSKSWLRPGTERELLEVQTYILEKAKRYTTRKRWTFVIFMASIIGSVGAIIAAAYFGGQLQDDTFGVVVLAFCIGIITFTLLSDLWRYPRYSIAVQYENLLRATTLEARASCLYTLGCLVELDAHEFFDVFHVRYWDCLIGTHYE
jgi:hypothetical protein